MGDGFDLQTEGRSHFYESGFTSTPAPDLGDGEKAPNRLIKAARLHDLHLDTAQLTIGVVLVSTGCSFPGHLDPVNRFCN